MEQRHPTDKERKAAHAAESTSISRRIADGDDFPEAGSVWRAFAQMKRSAQSYVTGFTALNIPIPGHIFDDWHSYGLVESSGLVLVR
jgi:hypothetical protein